MPFEVTVRISLIVNADDETSARSQAFDIANSLNGLGAHGALWTGVPVIDAVGPTTWEQVAEIGG